MIEATIQSELSSAAGVAGVIAGRIYPQNIPQRGANRTNPVWPLIVYQAMGLKPDYHMTNVCEEAKVTIEFECQSESYLTAKELANSVLAYFHKLTKESPKQLPGHWIESCFAEIQPDEFTSDISGKETGIHAVTVQAEITFI